MFTAVSPASPLDAATNYELDVIAAVVIGGTRLIGGHVSVVGTLIGAALMAAVRNGINGLNVDTFWRRVVVESIILIAIAIAIAYDGVAARRARRAARVVSSPVHNELAVR
ncbi:hypothetical protein M1E17_09445 [Arthrobacter sp. D1-29]